MIKIPDCCNECTDFKPLRLDIPKTPLVRPIKSDGPVMTCDNVFRCEKLKQFIEENENNVETDDN